MPRNGEQDDRVLSASRALAEDLVRHLTTPRLHPAFDPDLNGLADAEDACAAAVDEAHTLDVRLDLLQRELQDLRGLAVQQQDLLKRLIDILAGPQG